MVCSRKGIFHQKDIPKKRGAFLLKKRRPFERARRVTRRKKRHPSCSQGGGLYYPKIVPQRGKKENAAPCEEREGTALHRPLSFPQRGDSQVQKSQANSSSSRWFLERKSQVEDLPNQKKFSFPATKKTTCHPKERALFTKKRPLLPFGTLMGGEGATLY